MVPRTGDTVTIPQRLPGFRYCLWVVVLAIGLVKRASLSVRGAARAMQVMFAQLGLGQAPTASTARLWLLRVGLGQLRRPKVVRPDWIWLVDHSTQVDDAKCF